MTVAHLCSHWAVKLRLLKGTHVHAMYIALT